MDRPSKFSHMDESCRTWKWVYKANTLSRTRTHISTQIFTEDILVDIDGQAVNALDLHTAKGLCRGFEVGIPTEWVMSRTWVGRVTMYMNAGRNVYECRSHVCARVMAHVYKLNRIWMCGCLLHVCACHMKQALLTMSLNRARRRLSFRTWARTICSRYKLTKVDFCWQKFTLVHENWLSILEFQFQFQFFTLSQPYK